MTEETGRDGHILTDREQAIVDGAADAAVSEDYGDGQDHKREPVFRNVGEFVIYRFLPMYCRPPGNVRWCAEWWRHAEAVSRLSALWHSWEVLRLEPGTGMALWYRDHLDPQLNILLSDAGPFGGCTPEQHHAPTPLPSAPIPDDWFEDEW